jgi:hypothetical protein
MVKVKRKYNVFDRPCIFGSEGVHVDLDESTSAITRSCSGSIVVGNFLMHDMEFIQLQMFIFRFAGAERKIVPSTIGDCRSTLSTPGKMTVL